jgi:hypothetical protein
MKVTFLVFWPEGDDVYDIAFLNSGSNRVDTVRFSLV